MEVIERTENTQTQQYTFAGFWWRFLAYIIDDIIVDTALVIMMMPIYIMIVIGTLGLTLNDLDRFDQGFESPAEFFAVMGPFLIFIPLIIMAALLVWWLYYALMESSKYQGTVGKILLGIKVTDMQGNRISFAKASGRFFGKILSGLIFMIGYIMAGFTEKKQALHDILSDCLVIKIK